MEVINHIAPARTYREFARGLFKHFSRKSPMRSIAVQDSLGLWHEYPGNKARINADGYSLAKSPGRIACKADDVQKSLRLVLDQLEQLSPALLLKFEAIDLRQKLLRTVIMLSAQQRISLASEKRQQRKLRRRAGEEIGMFSRHSHDLKTPLSMLTIPLENLILRDEQIPAKLRLKLENIKLAIYSVLRGVGNTLDAARVLSGKRKSILIPHNFSDFSRSAAEVYAIVFASYGIEFTMEIEANIILEIDPLQMEKVLNNLLSNAIKHNIPGSSTLLALRTNGKFAELTVSDGGLGISYDKKSVAHDQARALSGWAFTSHGFGLKIVRELVRLNRGEFSLRSVTGVGTTATVRLPLADALKHVQHSWRAHTFDHTMHEVELLAAERTALSRRPKAWMPKGRGVAGGHR